MEVRVDRFGRVLIPKPLRDALGLEPGTVVEVEQADRACVLTRVVAGSDLRDEDGVLVFAGKAVGDLRLAVGAEREERLKKASGLA